MIATRTPFRVSFVGGGTDLPAFYRRHPGAVISTTIDKYMYIFVHEFFYNQIQLKYSQTELATDYDDIQHPIAREILRRFLRNGGLDVNSVADVPSGTGMGSSSTYTVGLLRAMYAYHGMAADDDLVAQEACRIEIDVLGSPIGKQDQYAAVFGGLNIIRFHEDDSVSVEPVVLHDPGLLEDHMLLFHVGKRRDANEVLHDQSKRTTEDHQVYEHLCEMARLPDEFAESLRTGDIQNCGRLLDENWRLKQKLSTRIHNDEVDHYYNVAKKCGAIGGKLLGAGGSGFFLVLAPVDTHTTIRSSLQELRELPVKLDTVGSTVLTLGEET